MSDPKTPWPKELRLAESKDTLHVGFDDGSSYDFPAEFLRVQSPSAEVQGHSPDQRVTVPKKKNVKISDLRPVGNYAVKIVFDDGHDTGLFSWTYLHELGSDQSARWLSYLKDLQDKGLSRE
jgi:DUF971 family protein